MALQIDNIVGVLQNEGVIVYPTETVYGIGGNALEQEVAEKVFRIKGREEGKPFIVLAKDLAMAETLADISSHKSILERYWPGALTGVFRAKGILPKGVVSDKNNIALRISSHPFVQELFQKIDFPLISTSANKSGSPSCLSIEEVKKSLGDTSSLVDEYVDYGTLPQSEPSTLVDFTQTSPTILRQGTVNFAILKT